MAPTTVSKNQLSKLPEEVFRLIAMGRYSLYTARSLDPRVVYALRTGAQDVVLLAGDGEPLDSPDSFEITGRATVSNISNSMTLNFVPAFLR